MRFGCAQSPLLLQGPSRCGGEPARLSRGLLPSLPATVISYRPDRTAPNWRNSCCPSCSSLLRSILRSPLLETLHSHRRSPLRFCLSCHGLPLIALVSLLEVTLAVPTAFPTAFLLERFDCGRAWLFALDSFTALLQQPLFMIGVRLAKFTFSQSVKLNAITSRLSTCISIRAHTSVEQGRKLKQ